MQLSSNRTRLHFDGVGPTITADVTRRRGDGMVVTQALPFLRLDTSVTESGQRSRIKRVTIAMDGDVPQLLLELLHEKSTPRTDEDTLESFTPGMSTRPARTDSTVPYGFDALETAKPIVVSGPPALALAVPEPQPSTTQPSTTQLPAARVSWFSRAWNRVLAVVATMTGMITR